MKYSSRGKKWPIAALMVAAALVLLTGTAAAESLTWVPNDPGGTGVAGGWQRLQWNFADTGVGVHAPQAWANLIADHRPGASGVKVAVLDTGVAYLNEGGFVRSPDLAETRFADGCDLVLGTIVGGRCTDPDAVDPNGHGTFVASEIAEATDNHYGLTGLAYGATIMPVRVLDDQAVGAPGVIAEGIRYAVAHGARVINLSLAFSSGWGARRLPSLISAIAYAHAHDVVLVAAAGNDGADSLDYPAADADVISVGATTADGCLASYSDTGPRLDLVAPGGGQDAALPEPICHPHRRLPGIAQVGFKHRDQPGAFAIDTDDAGTSMAAPEVSAAAALVIASGVLGPHPTPTAVLEQLERTAVQPTDGAVGVHNDVYGYGIVDAGAATAGARALR